MNSVWLDLNIGEIVRNETIDEEQDEVLVLYEKPIATERIELTFITDEKFPLITEDMRFVLHGLLDSVILRLNATSIEKERGGNEFSRER